MTVEMVQAIAGLWKLFLTVFLLLTIILLATVYRAQSRLFLGRLAKFRFKRGQTEISIDHAGETEAEESKKGQSLQEPVPAPSVAPAKTSADAETKAEEEETDWRMQMYRCFFKQDLDEAREAYEKMQAAETSPEQKIKNEAVYLQLCFEKGNGAAQQKIKDLEARSKEYPAVIPFLRRFDAYCYRFSENYGLFDGRGKGKQYRACR